MKRLILIVFLLVLAASLEARRLPRYPFIPADRNVLQFPGGESEEFDLFLRKLDTLLDTGKGDLRVLHVGGSHVQAGTWTDRLRAHFLALRYGLDGGRGLVFPFSAAGTNTPISYSSSYTGNWEKTNCLKPEAVLGLTGMAITAADTSARVAVDLLPRELHLHQPRYTFNRVDVLGEGTHYRAFIVEYDAALGQYVDRMGGMRSFTTEAPAAATTGYLNCYEVPGLTGILNGAEVSGRNSKKDDTWFRYYTNTSSRQIAVHTYTLDGKQVRNYIVMYDGSKYAPVWTVHAMHKSMWPDRGVGRNEDWTADPAISLTQQKGLDNAGSVGFSRGHLVASNYRQSSVAQNKQTFYYSNQAPQWQNGFNSGLWSSLEEAVAGHAPTGRDTLYVVSGVLYEGSVQTKPAKNADGTASLSVPIPSHFYKCLMKCSFDSSGNMTAAKGCAYIYENKAQSGAYSQGITTIDAIEARAGFDFFANVPAALQNAAESSSKSLW